LNQQPDIMSMVASLIGLCAKHPQKTFAAGSILLEEGRRAGVIYVLESGTVEIVKGGVAVSTVSHPGAVFGEISVLLEESHMATVRVKAESRFRVIERPMEFLREHPDAAMHVSILLARRLCSVMAALVDMKREFEGRREHVAKVDELLGTLLHLHARPRPPEAVLPQTGP
jgi:CRP/FNR family cyclic AMP-dependent transcriptional regulator